MAKIIDLGTSKTQHERIEIERPAHSLIVEINMGTLEGNELNDVFEDLKLVLVTTTIETRGDELDVCNRVPLLAVAEYSTMGEGYNSISVTQGEGEEDTFENVTIFLPIQVSSTDENFDLEQEEKFILSLFNLQEAWNVTIRTMETEGYGRDLLFYNRVTIRKETNKQLAVASSKFLMAILLDNNWTEIDKASKSLGQVTKVQKIDQVDLRLLNDADEDETYKLIHKVGNKEIGTQSRRNIYLFLDLSNLESYSIQTTEEVQLIHVTEREEV